MKIKFYQIDAFTDQVFSGNPAAVCPLDEWIDEDTMQNIAMENNLSDTAFFVKKGSEFEIRWFTPESEIDLCGHATLASAYVIFNNLSYDKDEINFKYGGGKLTVSRNNGMLEMRFPANPPVPVDTPSGLIEAIRLRPVEILKARDYILVYSNEEEIKKIQPDFRKLKTFDVTGFVVTAPGKEVDFVSRVFSPKMGIDEDPVTGSTHTEIIPYWAGKLNKRNMTALQLSRRGGKLLCKYEDDSVRISGNAIPFLVGEITL